MSFLKNILLWELMQLKEGNQFQAYFETKKNFLKKSLHGTKRGLLGFGQVFLR